MIKWWQSKWAATTFAYITSISWNITACCCSFSRAQRSNNFACDSVNDTGVSPSAKSCAIVIPNARQIFSREGTVGIIFFRYQDEMVDCGKPERSAS